MDEHSAFRRLLARQSLGEGGTIFRRRPSGYGGQASFSLWRTSEALAKE
jgi:hypothetical protein